MRRDLRVDHRMLGSGYILLAIVSGVVAAALSLCLRLPGTAFAQALRPADWHLVAVLHGPMLIVFSAIPALLGGYGNWFVPLMIGADDTAFPRLGLASLGLTALGFVSTLAGLLCGGSTTLLLVALYLSGTGLLLCSANLVATALNLRMPGLSLGRMTVFAWSQLIAAGLAIVAAPIVMAALTLVGLHRLPIAPDAPGLVRALVYPAYCVMILPTLGLVSEIVATFCEIPLVARRTAIVVLALLAGLGFLGWAHPLLQHGQEALGQGAARGSVMLQDLFVAVPVLCVIGCWAATVVRAPNSTRLLRTAPGLFSIGVVAVLVLGSLLQPLHDVLSLATGFAMFAGFYYWIGRMSGRRYPEALARLQFWLLAVGVPLTVLPRVADPMLLPLGASLISLSVLLFVLIAGITASRRRRKVVNAWGRGAVTLEWVVPPSSGA